MSSPRLPTDSPIDFRSTPDGVEFSIKAVPGASRSRVLGLWNRALRIAVAAPPHAGKANNEIVSLLADLLSLRRSNVAIVAGLTSPLKRIRVTGLSPTLLESRLRNALPSRNAN